MVRENAKQGNPYAQYSAGLLAITNNKSEEAIDYLEKAHKGNYRASIKLLEIYSDESSNFFNEQKSYYHAIVAANHCNHSGLLYIINNAEPYLAYAYVLKAEVCGQKIDNNRTFSNLQQYKGREYFRTKLSM